VSIESFLEWSQQQNRNIIKTLKGTVTSPKCVWILAPWGPQQVVEMRGISCRNHARHLLPKQYREVQTKKLWKLLRSANWQLCEETAYVESYRKCEKLSDSNQERVTQTLCATVLLDKQERSLSTGIQRFDFEFFYFDEGTASHSLCCRFANNRLFPNSPESVSKLWRYDWCKKHMSLSHGRQQHGRLRDTLMRSQWLSRWIQQREPAQPEMPHSREDFVVHSCIEVCFFPVETVTPTLTSDGAKKTLAFCCCALRCIWNSNELVCSKMEKEGSRSNETLQVQKGTVVAIWRCDRIAMVLWNLIWSELKPHDNFVLPHHLKSIIRQFDLQIIPRLCWHFAVLCYTVDK